MGRARGVAAKAEVAQRRARAVQMRLAGMSYQAICDQLGYASAGAVSKDVTRALRAAAAAQQENSEELLQLEVDRLDRLMAGLWSKAISGDTKAVEVIEKLIYRRTTLLGLDLINRNGVHDGDVKSLLGALFETLQAKYRPAAVEAEVVQEIEAADAVSVDAYLAEAEEAVS